MIHPPDIMNKLLEPSDCKGEVHERMLLRTVFVSVNRVSLSKELLTR